MTRINSQYARENRSHPSKNEYLVKPPFCRLSRMLLVGHHVINASKNIDFKRNLLVPNYFCVVVDDRLMSNNCKHS